MKTAKLSMIVLVLCLSVCLSQIPFVFASSESLYVMHCSNGFGIMSLHSCFSGEEKP